MIFFTIIISSKSKTLHAIHDVKYVTIALSFSNCEKKPTTDFFHRVTFISCYFYCGKYHKYLIFLQCKNSKLVWGHMMHHMQRFDVEYEFFNTRETEFFKNIFTCAFNSWNYQKLCLDIPRQNIQNPLFTSAIKCNM